ncbi:RNA polymerase sigma factor [Spirosoma flavus]
MKQVITSNLQTGNLSNTGIFETLYNQYVKKVFHKCLTMTQDPEQAQDYTQDIFLKVFVKLDQFTSKSALSTWLFAITHNYCLDQIKLNKKLQTESLTYHLINETEPTDESISSQERLALFNQVLIQLPVEETTLLKLKYEHDMSIAELSSYYRVTQTAMKMRLKRTRDKLAKQYAEKCNQHDLS